MQNAFTVELVNGTKLYTDQTGYGIITAASAQGQPPNRFVGVMVSQRPDVPPGISIQLNVANVVMLTQIQAGAPISFASASLS